MEAKHWTAVWSFIGIFAVLVSSQIIENDFVFNMNYKALEIWEFALSYPTTLIVQASIFSVCSIVILCERLVSTDMERNSVLNHILFVFVVLLCLVKGISMFYLFLLFALPVLLIWFVGEFL